MPEDDFDIYGEDESYIDNSKAEVAPCSNRKLHFLLTQVQQDAGEYEVKGFGEEGNDDFAVEPTIGEKRPREEDQDTIESEKDSAKGDFKKELSNETGATNASSKTDSALNGTATHNTGAIQSGLSTGYDALYIGDLQWVRCLPVLLRLRLYSESAVFSMHVHSGLQMKTCVKLHITSVLTLSSKISLSLNTKLMGKVKGKLYDSSSKRSKIAQGRTVLPISNLEVTRMPQRLKTGSIKSKYLRHTRAGDSTHIP